MKSTKKNVSKRDSTHEKQGCCQPPVKGKHFFWTSLHFFWTWALLLDLTTILLEMATLLLDLHTLLLDLSLPSCSTWPFPKPYPFRINSTVSVQPRLHRNFSDSRVLELR